MYIKPFGDECRCDAPASVLEITPAEKSVDAKIPSVSLHLSLRECGVSCAGMASLRLNAGSTEINTSDLTAEIRFFTRTPIPLDLKYSGSRVTVTSWNGNVLRAVEQCCEAAGILRRLLDAKP